MWGKRSLPVIVFWFFCFPASPGWGVEFAGGTGELADPYRIATAEQLLSIGNDPNLLNTHYRLIADIDLAPGRPEGRVFEAAPIASYTGASPRPEFTGRFFGDDHTISNLTISDGEGQYLGLFGAIGPEGRVYDLTLERVRIEGNSRLGALAGVSEGGVVNCTATGRILGRPRSRWLGGLIAVNLGGMANCRVDVAVEGGDNSLLVGGLVGLHQGRIVRCEAAGDVLGGPGSSLLGGMVGMSLGGAIEDSFASATVSGGDRGWGIGGLAGRLDSGSLVLRCRTDGVVSGGAGSYDLGALVGQNWYARIDGSYATGPTSGASGSHRLGGLVGSCLGGRIVSCYATGAVRGRKDSRFLGGLVGQLQARSVVLDCYAAGPVLVSDEPAGRGGLIGHIASPGDTQVAGAFWDVQTSGASSSAVGRGLSTAQMYDRQTFRSARWDLLGDRADGTTDTWRVPEGGGYPLLTAFSDPNELHALEGAGRSFDPYLIATAEDLGAISRYDRRAWFKLVEDIDLSGITWSRAPISDFYGFFDGHAHRISNLTIRSAAPSPVGLFGRIESDAWVYDLGLEEVAIDAYFGSSEVGGLAGVNAGNVVACFATGNISAGGDSRSLGGLVGANRRGAIADCYAVATVTAREGSNQVGGLVGYNFQGPLVNCYAVGAVLAPHTTEHLGYLVGYTARGTPTVNCYYLTDFAHGGRDFGAGKPLTDEQLRQQASFDEWDFAKVWRLCENETYPHLRWERIICESP